MKRISYFMLSLLALLVCSCAETEQPYVGYIVIERAVVDADANSTATLIADTDINSPIKLTVNGDAAEWCSVSVSGKEIHVTATQANTGESFRTATVTARCGYRETSFTVLQKFNGQQYLEYDWTKWTATGNNCQTNDGGGYPSLFNEDRSTFWHSQYNPNRVDLPWWIVVDMKEELECHMFQIGRRYYAAYKNNYGTVKHMDIYGSTDNENFTKIGEFSFDLPWTAPDGTVVTGATSPLIPAYEEVKLSEPVTARYIKMVITETNGSSAQVAYLKVYEKI
ncbi:discoidin domain-containing protein [uncultured Bacteroides sp.]|uniref:discoidin domain-containing protein n=1 Tax=uncultured Bacteroides sp. TaxID=162156 RepID=UPI0023BC7E9D|nr:discoidin domain-containing protein [uncultured Bacteroides sp.]MDE5709791.1 discoidin domain-containing protein [Bacteroides sp.]